MRYKAPTTFADKVVILVCAEEFNGVRLRLRYEMQKGGQLVFEGRSEHCFLDGSGKLLRLQRACPEVYETLKNAPA